MLLSSIIIFAIIILDQVTKALAVRFLPIACNTGFAFGLLPDFWNVLWVALTILVVGYFFLRSHLEQGETLSKWHLIGLWLILAGAISNLLDRLVRGCVIDFIDLKIWPAFNVADAAISIGVVLLILSLVKKSFKKDVSKGSRNCF